MGGRTAQEASPLRAFSGRIADSRGQVQPLTAENLEIWTNALNEYREEMHTAFLMRYVRDQSRLAQTMPRVLGKAQPTSAPSEPKSKDMVAIEEVLSSTEKPAKRNLVLGMRKKDGSTPDAPTP